MTKQVTELDIDTAIGVTGIRHHGLVSALLNRGHSAEAMKNMTAFERLAEALEWNGLTGWTPTIVNMAKGAGFEMYQPKQLPATNEVLKYIEGVALIVEADRHAQHYLWERYAQDSPSVTPECGLTWKSAGGGPLTCVGIHGNREVWISLMADQIDGKKVLFYYSSGTFTDHNMIESWFKYHLPGVRETDPTNFRGAFR